MIELGGTFILISICYESTKQCNLNCEYCISSDNPSDVADDRYESILKTIQSLKPQRIVISGGEPLLDPILFRKLEFFKRFCKHAFISLSTNGTIRFDFNKLENLVDCIDFSLPALSQEKYYSLRGHDFVDIVKNNIIKASDSGHNVRISFMLTKYNKDELFDILDFAEKAKVKSVRIGRYLPFRNAFQFKSKYELSDNELEELMNQVEGGAYSFSIIPPITSLSAMEAGYINIDYEGTIFLPTEKGKSIIGNTSSITQQELLNAIHTQEAVFKKIELKNTEYPYYQFLFSLRMRDSSPRISADEFYSDRTRVIYSPYFRRMQQKAQVFSLEKNSSIRSRLTHTIEASDIGKRIAIRVANKLASLDDSYKLQSDDIESIISIVENSCLIHDIGNPPFGHFGEAAIRKWWEDNGKVYIDLYNSNAREQKTETIEYSSEERSILFSDFREFDGNPQGIRNILRFPPDSRIDTDGYQSGLNLSFPTILASIKYLRAAGETLEGSICESLIKKAGYFQSELQIVKYIYESMAISRQTRHFLVYLMEAADDIAYHISDIADGIEKNVITIKVFIEEFKNKWERKYNESVPHTILDDDLEIAISKKSGVKYDFHTTLGAKWKTLIINEAVDAFTDHIDEYLDGQHAPVLDKEFCPLSAKILNVILEVSKEYIYISPEAEEIEIAGYSIVYGILEYFGKLLALPEKSFIKFANGERPTTKMNLDIEWRIFNRLSKNCVESYKAQLIENRTLSSKIGLANVEWWLRVHLIIDHISGMTDDYALRTYQVCKGISIEIF